MTEPEHELDRTLAERLRSAADQEPYRVLDEGARQRVLHALVAPAKPAPRWHWVGVALAAAAALAVWLRPTESARVAVVCALPMQVKFVDGALELGKYGRVVLAADAQARVSRSEACALEIALARGFLAAELHDLRPAELRVRTPLGAVEVHGTTFSVRVDDALEVVLLEGAVQLEETSLTPNHALTRRAHERPQLAALRREQAEALRALLSPPPISATPATPQEPEPEPEPTPKLRSATELLAAAERERRQGDVARARALYREAGGAEGADAEVALLRWARFELDRSEPEAALNVLARHRTRFGRARLGAEASFLEVQALKLLGRDAEATQRMKLLRRRYPDSPQATWRD